LHNPAVLTDNFRAILRELEQGHDNYLITGKAGTGKSTLLRLFAKTTAKNHVVLAPTGVAALNAGGQTIHSFFGFPPRMMDPSELRPSRKRKMYQKLETIVIDEISMVRADMIDLIDKFLKLQRKNTMPFGGVQMVFFGDVMQIPPVIAHREEAAYLRSRYISPYFFSAHVFELETSFRPIELTEVFRQKDHHFIKLLDQIRLGSLDYDDLDFINERCQKIFPRGLPYIHLSARNAAVDRTNRAKLDELNTSSMTFPARTTGVFQSKNTLADEILVLKENAQVMFLKNDPEGKYVNGTLGIVDEMTNEAIRVKTDDEVIELGLATWEMVKYNFENEKIHSEVVGTFTQFPLKLAWAMTIHKSQGKTFDRALIDLGRGAFTSGQTYVALSRCRELEGISLSRPLQMSDIITDRILVEFNERMRRI
jgi:ATP-dependent exoDNAse (exonuclease V) alpha subunit